MIDIDKIIGEQLLSENDGERRKRQVGEYYCTDLGYCSRKTWYKYKDIDLEEADETERIRMLKIFERGNLLHEWVTERLRKYASDNGGFLKDEVSIAMPNLKDHFIVRGRIDNLIQWSDHYEIIEVKTTARIKKRGMPMYHHVAQVMPYLMYAPNAKASILYLEPATLKMESYPIHYDMFEMEELWKKASRIHHDIQFDILPDAEAKLNKEMNWECKYCEFSAICDQSPEKGDGLPTDSVPLNGCKDEFEEVKDLDAEDVKRLKGEGEDKDPFIGLLDEVTKEVTENIDEPLVSFEDERKSLEDKWQEIKKKMDDAEEDAKDE